MKNSTRISKNSSTKLGNIAILKKQFENFGSEEILDANCRLIGKIEIPFQHLNKKLEIKDLTRDKVIELEKMNKIFSKTCVIKEKEGQLIAKVKKNRLSIYPSKISFINNSKTNEYIASGNFKRYNYKIIDIMNNNVIATVKNVDKRSTPPIKIQSDASIYYYINYNEDNLNRIIIIAFTICINHLIKYSSGISDIASFERRFARLRPFGPGRNLN